MRKQGDANAAEDDDCAYMIDDGVYLDANATLETAMPLFERANFAFIPVVDLSQDGPPQLVGALFQVDALKAYNRALAATAAEEHS